MKSIKVTRNGKAYDIPEAWIAVHLTSGYGTEGMQAYEDAVDLWIEQEEMSRRLEGEI